MHITNAQARRTFTLGAGVEKDVAFDAEGMDVTHADSVTVIITAGPNNIITVRRYLTTFDAEWPDPLNYGPVPAGTTARITWDDVKGKGLRVTCTAPADSTAAVEILATASP